jgi:hypothetical protein
MLDKRHALAIGLTLTLQIPWTARPLDAQLYQGPEQGTSIPGIITRTTDFASMPPALLEEIRRPPPHTLDLLPDPIGLRAPAAPQGANEQDDLGWLFPPAAMPAAPGLLRSFEGIKQTSSIPPDPILAVGPDHIMALVNRDFAVFSKDGSNLQQIRAPTWFSNIVPGNNAFDPKVIYDHFDERWVMVWLAVVSDADSSSSYILVAVSDDSDPMGEWCNFAFRGDYTGSTRVSNWSDYQGLGFDQSAVYVVPNQFGFEGGWFGAKIRILPKAELYDAACPAVTYTDFWDLRDPDFPDVKAGTTRPAVTFGSPGVEYLISDSPFSTGTTMTLWSLTNPLDPTPTLTATNVPVTERRSPPNADQLGGSSILISVGGSRVRNVVYRDGSVWTAHSVADATGAYARARYVRIDVTGPTLLEDVAFGRDGCWLYYPAITADPGGNMTMVYNQSCTDEYIGIRYTGRRPLDEELRPSALLKAGEENYVKDYGSGRNRWGDYNGIAIDPSDPSRVWMYSEYAASPTNTWGTWVGEVMARSIGDVNDDGDVNVGDVVLLVDIILERTVPDQETLLASDCNRDRTVDIGDVVCVVDIVLGGSGSALMAAGVAPGGERATERAGLSMTPESGRAGYRTVLLEADLGAGAAGVQALIRFDPAKVSLGQPELADRVLGFQLAAHQRDGELLVLVYDAAGRTLPGGSGPLVRIPVGVLSGSGVADESGLELIEMLVANGSGSVRHADIVEAQMTALPLDFRLSNPYPNPVAVGQGTKLDLEIPDMVRPALAGEGGGRRTGTVRVVADVYNVRGQRIRQLLSADLTPGQHTVVWDGRNDRGEFVGAGLYVLRLRAGEFAATRKLIVPGR